MIQFKVTGKTQLKPDDIVNGLFNESNWTSFTGKGLVPGIQKVEIIRSGNEVTGTRFNVTNTDGSKHVETITSYDPGLTLIMKLHQFSFPLNKFADHFYEKWTFNQQNEYTYLERSFEMFPKNLIGSVLLRFIAYFFKKAVADHTQYIANQE